MRLITPIYDLEEPARAEERLQEFMREFVPVIEEFIPGEKTEG